MRRPRVAFTVRGLGIAVALVGINLAGAIATSKFYPRPHFLPVIDGTGGGRRVVLYHGDGSVTAHYGDFEQSPSVAGRRSEVIRPARPPGPSLMRIWSPVVASAMITLLTLAVAVRRRPATSDADERAS